MADKKMTRADLLAAYARHEKAAGGPETMPPEGILWCIRRAADECGMTFEQARDALREAWAGMRG